MAKFSRSPRLDRQMKEELILEFCEALAALKNPREALSLIKDILTEQEIEMLAKRLRIARLLLEGATYGEVNQQMRVGLGTIARVSEWLRVSGEGYRLVVDRVKKREPRLNDADDERLADRRPALYYWPELLIEELARKAKGKYRDDLRRAIQTVGQKTRLYKKLNAVLEDSFRS